MIFCEGCSELFHWYVITLTKLPFNYLLLYLLVYRECADVEEEPLMDIRFCPRCLKEPKIDN